MLSKILVKGYKKLSAEVVLTDLKKVNYLVGKNNSGKSSFLEAVSLVLRFLDAEKKRFQNNTIHEQFAKKEEYFFNKNTSKEIEVKLDDHASFKVSWSGGNLQKSPSAENIIGDYVYPKCLYIPCDAQISRQASSLDGRTFSSNLLSNGQLPSGMIEAWIWTCEKKLLEERKISVLGESDKFHLLKKITASNFGIYLTEPDIDSESNEKVLRFREKGLSKKMPLYLLGSGTRNIVNLIGAIIYASDYDLILVDEPELHLFPSIERLLPNILDSVAELTGKQIIIATQSPFIVSNIDSEKSNIYLFKKNDADEIAIENNLKGHENSLALAMELGSNDPVAIGAPRNFVLLEESSLQVLLEHADSSFYDKKLQFISSKGITNIAKRAESIQNIVSHASILRCTSIYSEKYFVVVDNYAGLEERSQNKLNKIKDKIGDRFIELEKPRLEDYYPEDIFNEYFLSKSIPGSSRIDFFTHISSLEPNNVGIAKNLLANLIKARLQSKGDFETMFPQLKILFR